jgi:hypothetical protein
MIGNICYICVPALERRDFAEGDTSIKPEIEIVVALVEKQRLFRKAQQCERSGE